MQMRVEKLPVRLGIRLCASNVVPGMQMRFGKLPVRLGIRLCASNVVPGMQMRVGKLPVRLGEGARITREGVVSSPKVLVRLKYP